MARAAVPGRLSRRLAWRVGRLVAARDETPSARTLGLEVPGWPGHLAGQHVDLRLTAPDGYAAQRSYSLAAPADGDRIELTVQRVPDGEVSEYLTGRYSLGDPVEIRGPLGGWFVWRPTDTDPIQLVGGGSGIVPLMAMVRARAAAGSRVPFRLLYSVRSPEDGYYTEELQRRSRVDYGLDVTYCYTRQARPDWPGTPHRIGVADVNTAGWPVALAPTCFVCGPTGFVETAADILVALGHDPHKIKTERFGPTGG